MSAKNANSMNVSRETKEALEHYVSRLLHWNKRINLISKSSVSDLWERHIFDSYQVFQYASGATGCWIDLGSGAGLPALICAICAKGSEQPLGFRLIESDNRKAVFMRQIIHELSLPVCVEARRIEQVEPCPADILTARALAPLSVLFDYASSFLSDSTCCLFPKGKNWRKEVQIAQKDWYFDFIPHPSESEPVAVILEIRNLKRLECINPTIPK